MNFESHSRLKRERARIFVCVTSSLLTPAPGLSLVLIVSQQVGVEASSSKVTSNLAVQVVSSVLLDSSRMYFSTVVVSRAIAAALGDHLRDRAVAGRALQGQDVAVLRRAAS